MELTTLLYVVAPLNKIMTDSPPENNDAQSLDLQPTSDAPPLDILFDVLANQRRRYILHCLRAYQTPMSLADLADEVATWEQNEPIKDISAEEVKRVYMSLYHSHIPKLVDANIIKYTQERDLVMFSKQSEHVELLLEFVAAEE